MRHIVMNVIHETEKAYLVEGNRKERVWLPKSHVAYSAFVFDVYDDKIDAKVIAIGHVTDWFVKKLPESIPIILGTDVIPFVKAQLSNPALELRR